MITVIILVCSMKSMCSYTKFDLIGGCVSELHAHVCPYQNYNVYNVVDIIRIYHFIVMAALSVFTLPLPGKNDLIKQVIRMATMSETSIKIKYEVGMTPCQKCRYNKALQGRAESLMPHYSLGF